MFFIGTMGLGGMGRSAGTFEVIYNVSLIAITGALPNLFVLFLSLIFKKRRKENLVWSLMFSLIIIIVYFYIFSDPYV